MRVRSGFTLLEMLVVLTIAAVVLGITIPRVSAGISEANLQGAASVIAGDMQLAHSMAARQRTPVRIAVDTINRIIRIRDHATPTTVYSIRSYASGGSNPVSRLVADDTLVVVYPNGLSDGPMTVTVSILTKRRTISLSRAGQIRISE